MSRTSMLSRHSGNRRGMLQVGLARSLVHSFQNNSPTTRGESRVLLAVSPSLRASFAFVFARDLPILLIPKILLGFSIGFSIANPP
jgi:hypothetical protein